MEVALHAYKYKKDLLPSPASSAPAFTHISIYSTYPWKLKHLSPCSDILQDLLGKSIYCNPSSEFWVCHRKPPKQMSDPPQLIDAKEHQLYSKLPLDNGAHQARLRKKKLIQVLVSWILFFQSDLHVMTKDDGWNVDKPENRDFSLSNQPFLHHNRQKQHPHYC